mgnify:CR=1 FL=1
MQKKHMERFLFTLLVLLIFALTILGLYRVTKHSAAPASTTIPVVSPAASPADDPTATSSPTPKPSPTVRSRSCPRSLRNYRPTLGRLQPSRYT